MNMPTIIYHNPKCSKSRQALEILNAAGLQPTVIEYLKCPLEIETLRSFGLPARDLLRTTEKEYADLNLADGTLSDEDIFGWIVKYPNLLQRPVVQIGNQTILARPPELIKNLLASKNEAS